MATYIDTINSQRTESGDDLYGKPLDGNLTGANWDDDSEAAIEVADTNVYEIVLDETKGYIFYRNEHLQSFTADAGTDVITANAHGLINGETLRFKGSDLPSGLVQVTLYYVRDVTTNTFKVSATSNGAAINLADAGSGVMTFTAPSKRSKASDTKIGTAPIVKAATLTGEGEASLVAAIVASAVGTNAATAATQASSAATSAASGAALASVAATQSTTAATQTAAAALRTSLGLESANLANLVNAVIGKKVVTPVGDGRFDIAVRNAADSATLVTVRHNPVTGDTVIL